MSLFYFTFLLLPAGIYLFWVSPARVLRRVGAFPAAEVPAWNGIVLRMDDMAHRHRMPVPRLWVIPDFSPNALVLRPWGKRLQVALTEGLLRSLSEEELNCVFALCLSHGAQRGRAWQTWLGLVFYPLSGALQKYPAPLQVLLAPVLTAVLRLSASQKQFLRADLRAAEFQSQWRIASLLQKLSVFGRKIPLRHWNFALDSLFLVSPLVIEDTPLWSFPVQPSIEIRREKLLQRPTCESAASLP